MMNDLKAVAFDVDGTMYCDWRLWLKCSRHIFSNIRFFLNFWSVRRQLHRAGLQEDFFEEQARLVAEKMKISASDAVEKIRVLVYDGLKPYFNKVKAFVGLEDFLAALKKKGMLLGVLSDFPPEQKGEMWNLEKYFDVIIGSEMCGALKPDSRPFLTLAKMLGCAPSEILYVGNSLNSDIRGAKNAGMKTAYLLPFWRRVFGLRLREADISFGCYKELHKAVLES